MPAALLPPSLLIPWLIHHIHVQLAIASAASVRHHHLALALRLRWGEAWASRCIRGAAWRQASGWWRAVAPALRAAVVLAACYSSLTPDQGRRLTVWYGSKSGSKRPALRVWSLHNGSHGGRRHRTHPICGACPPGPIAGIASDTSPNVAKRRNSCRKENPEVTQQQTSTTFCFS